jgi:DNA cross-link repair 1A protein
MRKLFFQFLTRYLEQHRGIFTDIVAFIPTGWEMSRKNESTNNVSTTQRGKITIYGIPYSEHSSFTELKRFVQFLKPAEVIPTVNVKCPTKQNAMTKYFRQWLSESPVTSLKQKRERHQFVQQKMSLYLKSPRKGTDEDL